jgi:hypothetical protein
MKRHLTYMDIQTSARRCRTALILTAAALLFLFGAALSLRADIVLNDNGTVTKDGVSLNNASDALANGAITSAEFMAALQSKLAAATEAASKAQADVVALQATMRTQLQGDLKTLQEALKTQTGEVARAEIAGKISLIQGYLAAAFKTPDELKAEALAAEIEAKQAELLKLQAVQGNP